MINYRFTPGSKGRALELYLLSGNVVTNAQALSFGITGSSLPKYIQMLREKYHIPEGNWKHNDKSRWVEYKIVTKETSQAQLFS